MYRSVSYRRPEAPHVTLTPVNGALALSSTYNAAFVTAIKALPFGSRRWDGTLKVWLIDPSQGQRVAALCRQYLGVEVHVPTVPTPTTETRILKVDYLGACKDRGDGESSSNAWIDGAWAAVFPERVLREWFEGDIGLPERPSTTGTLYSRLAIQQTATEQEVRSAYRRLARQWHPDVCHEPDAARVFRQVQAAYEVLGDDTKRRKYDAGLRLQQLAAQSRIAASLARDYLQSTCGEYRPLLRCGYVLCEGTQVVGRFVVSKIVQWEDIVDAQGRVMVASWPYGAKEPEIRWRQE